jgi:hypothetical protein
MGAHYDYLADQLAKKRAELTTLENQPGIRADEGAKERESLRIEIAEIELEPDDETRVHPIRPTPMGPAGT